MQNAQKYSDGITIGAVPSHDDLKQLKDLGYRTIVDVRDEDEKFGGIVGKTASSIGLNYVGIPTSREDITIEDVTRFYQVVYDRATAPVYAFSRFGKRPLVFVLLFDVLANNDPIAKVFREAGKFGLSIEGNIYLRTFVVKMMNSGELAPVIESFIQNNPELRSRKVLPREPSPEAFKEEDISTTLQEATSLWTTSRDLKALRRHLASLSNMFEG